ncbi:hypothetical protein [Burkholderia sp. WP9]|uniref:hypothetical protein n=1 Tax=Burkholderia sp. WP9 TaxID=1500263 RepID=UPI00257113AA|nr:hypothetical protein [Burkholderia sp. WP9]
MGIAKDAPVLLVQRFDQIVDTAACFAAISPRLAGIRRQGGADQAEYRAAATNSFAIAVLGIVFGGAQMIVGDLICKAPVSRQFAFRLCRARFNARGYPHFTPDKSSDPHVIARALLIGGSRILNTNSKHQPISKRMKFYLTAISYFF